MYNRAIKNGVVMQLTKQQIINHLKDSLTARNEQPGVNEAIFITSFAMLEARDKSGDHYGLHWSGVAFDVPKSDVERQIAILHDLLEDTDWTDNDLREVGFSERVIAGVVTMTRDEENESYFDFIERCSKNPDALHVKLSDLRNNMDQSRNKFTIGERDMNRINRYALSYQYLKAVEEGMIVAGLPIEDFVHKHPLKMDKSVVTRVFAEQGRKLPTIKTAFKAFNPA